MLELIVEPGRVRLRDEFKNDPETKYGIALDGYISGIPWVQRSSQGGPRINFNHHESENALASEGLKDIYRFTTLSTCNQVRRFIKTHGLSYLGFRNPDGDIKAKLYTNDSDLDTSIAIWELMNADLFESKRTNDRLKELLGIEDDVDVTAGAYPYDLDDPRLKTLYWISEPYNIARMAGKLNSKMPPEDMKQMILDIGDRITRHVRGEGQVLEPDIRYRTIYEEPKWIIIEEIGAQGRAHLFKDQKKELVVTMKQNGNGYMRSTWARRYTWSDIDLDGVIADLNALDGNIITPYNCWGGSNDSLGSPRATGTKATIDQIIQIARKRMGPDFNKDLYIP